MFFLDEKLMDAIPSITLWSNGNKLQISENAKKKVKNNVLEQPTSKYFQSEIDRWQKYFSAANEEMTGGILRSYIFIKLETGNKSIEGISNEFSKLKNTNQIIEFAFTYGNLGLALEQKERDMFEQLSQLDSSYVLTSWNAFENVKPGFTYFEPFELWWYHIDKVRKILKLYRALSRLNRGLSAEIEDSILRIGEPTYYRRQKAFTIEWFDGTPTLVNVKEEEASDFLNIGRLVLRKSIERYASNGIVIKASEIIETEKNALGFYVLEKKTTEYLITAIYYDLWQLINANMVVDICQNPKCQLPFMKIKRQQYCSDACKQEAYRERKKNDS
ncbi:hypothetical protein [Peribacillus frigoritolerans]|uniref:hypothetical protein n=1 Tax=Peribacillus frigoritolerans TaxID=450367 RepID=UPI001F4FC556|nr:hypothetical protein [Peribacillus frigoritolerans]MCK2020686.1 hypothetical protein [Peribacillus frigoritolerans]